MRRRQSDALLFIKSHEPLDNGHEMAELDPALELLDEELEPVDVLHVRNARLYANVLLHHRLHTLHRQVVVLLSLRRALRPDDHGEEWVDLPVVVDLESVEGLLEYELIFGGAHDGVPSIQHKCQDLSSLFYKGNVELVYLDLGPALFLIYAFLALFALTCCRDRDRRAQGHILKLALFRLINFTLLSELSVFLRLEDILGWLVADFEHFRVLVGVGAHI
mmetsp:Transcript_19694/g.24281  ORF Transcript_19694/g.24281 Transcript_19694/m.24281 type:complete len:220 (+) Transcript_19694:1653-2312(+)